MAIAPLPREQVLDRIAQDWIVAVVRAETNEQALKIAEALHAGRVRCIEITFTCPDAPAIIRALAEKGASDMLVGAGTVCTREQAAAAIDAGAQFLVSPGLAEEVIEVAKTRNIAMMAGAVTPTEVMAAARLGADVIKLFPGSLFGPAYAKALAGPFPKLKFMPTGGVSLENLKDWKAAGVVAVGVGTELVQKEAVAAGRYELITNRAKAFVEAAQRAGGGTIVQRRG
jgi:2-dehydro-3-deoxyphosphogluconate aldolase/(4S)-4-hydroxy-2-oxoglutarate aldolase